MSEKELKLWYDRASKDGRTDYRALCECDYCDDWGDRDDYSVTDDATLQDYAEYGVTVKNGLYYCNGEAVRCFLDIWY